MEVKELKQLKQTKYSIDDVTVIIPNDPKEHFIQKSDIISLKIIRDIDNSMFPLLLLECGVNYSIVKKIEKNKGNVKFKIKLNKSDINNNDVDMNHQFSKVEFDNIFTDFDENIYTNAFQMITEKDNMTDDEIAHSPLDKVTKIFGLFLNSAMQHHQQCLTDGIIVSMSVMDSLVYTLNKFSVNQFLITTPDNKVSYSDFLLPNKTLLGTLEEIEYVYGIYNSGFRFFWDLDVFYILDCKANSRAYRTKEIERTIIHFEKPDSVSINNNGCYVDREAKVNRINGSIYPEFFSNEKFNGKLGFTELISLNPSKNSGDSYSTNNKYTPNVRLLENKYGNSFHASSLAYMNSSNNLSCNISLDNVDIDMLTPNKEIIIKFEDHRVNEQYNGSYRISYTECLFTNKQGYFDCSVKLILKKEPK